MHVTRFLSDVSSLVLSEFYLSVILRLSVAIIRTMYPKKYMMNFMILLMGQTVIKMAAGQLENC